KLVQMQFPSLSSKFLPFDFPFEVYAKLIKKAYAKQLNLNEQDIGISYITECLANLNAIKQPLGKPKSNIDLVFLLSTLFKDILQHIHFVNEEECEISPKGILWSKVGAIRRTTSIIDYLSVDGINHVRNILEKAELGQLNHIKILECYSCVGGCVGGTFTLENPFIAKTKVNGLYEFLKSKQELISYQNLKELLNEELWSFEKTLECLNVNVLDVDFLTSLVKLQTINELYERLPKIDCSACGSPSCRSLAEDVALGIKKIEDCVVLNLKDGCDEDESDRDYKS
ncbi:MAG: (Fe-S)-binding protein, partial [Turicibacter sp.]